MRIVHVITRLNVGGAALSLLELAAAQHARGNDVRIVAGDVPPNEASMEPLVDELGLELVRVPTLQREIDLRADVRATRSVRAALGRRPDIVHTHMSKAGVAGRVAALAPGVSRARGLVHTYHGHVLSSYFGAAHERVFRAVERLLARPTDILIAVSTEVRDDLVRFGVAPRDRFSVVPYGFDLDRRIGASDGARASKRATLGLGDDFVVGWAGRLTAIKRPLDLVETTSLVDDAHLVVVGDGELRADVESLAARLGVADRVHVVGYVDDIAEWYAAFDCFLLTSANEGTPVAAIEALAAGVPVVATAAGGTAAVVDDEVTGFLRPVGDTNGLAAAIVQLRDDVGLRDRMAAAGAAAARERFSIDVMVRTIDALYERALA